MDESTRKRCSRCAEVKPVADFGVNRAASDGLMYHCKACVRAGLKALTPEQREARRKRNAEHMARRRADAEKGAEIAARQAEWFKVNGEKAREYKRKFVAENPEKIREWRERDREGQSARSSAYAKANPERGRMAQHLRRARLRNATVGPVDMGALWTGLCGICKTVLDRDLKYPDPMSPSVDHIVALSRGGSHTQDNLQWAHRTCNLRKYVNPQ